MTAAKYSERRKRLFSLLQGESGIVIFTGNAESPAQYFENAYKWRQDSTWLYFFGIDEPLFAAILDLDSGEETVYADDYGLDDIIWTGPMPAVSSLAAEAGVGNSAPYAAFGEAVKAAVAAGRKVHFLPVSRYYNAILLGGLLGVEPSKLFRSGKKGCPLASEPLVRAVVKMRLVKDGDEIRLLDEAAELGWRMHTRARRGIHIGRVEQEIVGEMENEALSFGWGVSFPTILTQHGEIFHCHSHAAALEPGRLLLIDAGVESNSHYASDHTRTYPTGGRFTLKQREIYQLVYECNELAFNMIKPGVKYCDCHTAVSVHLLDGLGRLGLVKGDPEELAAMGVAGLFMPHGLGHNMGLDVHDMEDYGEDLVGYDDGQSRSALLGLGSLRMARALVPGNVITDEPGIYFIPALISRMKEEGFGKGAVNYSKLETYCDFGGIRLEDDVLVTEAGARRLGSRRLPIAPDDVEEAMINDETLWDF